ncbi:MAG TPA: hypothetical protein VFK87_05640 [Steroidobacteraceae bacterium]|nr:hypothetical protein [Steroidobacteraceae bacterium]
MNIRSLQRGLRYCGRVAAVRQTYHVFESQSYYLLLSFARARTRRGSGYFNLVEKPAVDYVRQRAGGNRGVTANDVVTLARRTGHVATRLVALNVLYVLVALGQARIARAGEHRQLSFAVRRVPPPRPR